MSSASFLAAVVLSGVAGQYPGEIDDANAGVRYVLLEGSTFTDLYDLSPADPIRPLDGSFFLRRTPADAPWPRYALSHVRFDTVDTPPSYSIRGGGWYRLYDQNPTGRHELHLEVTVNGNAPVITMDSGVVPWDVPFPTIEIDAVEPPVSNDHRFAIHLIAEPVRTIWFSTDVGFTSGTLGGVGVSDGDLLSSSGRIVRTNAQLTSLLGIMPIVPDIGLDAVARTPATNSILFSSEVDEFSETQGPLQHGDLLNEYGFIMATNQQLTAAFVPQPVVPDAGLDGAHVALHTGEIWFSLEDPLFSQALGVILEPGDLLSDAGAIVKTNLELLQRFQIQAPLPDGYGLDAVCRLPNGTIWFSTEVGFIDARFGQISDGDLLSNQGHVIRRNLDLVWPFGPVEDLHNFGLDAVQPGGVISVADANQDGAIDLADYAQFEVCLTGPGGMLTSGCEWADLDADHDVDVGDFGMFQWVFIGE